MKILMILLFISSTSLATVPILFDEEGYLIEPDSILLSRGLKEYKKGRFDASMIRLKKSAQFGNDSAKYLIGLIHLKDYNSIKARAWLMLINKPVYHTTSILEQLNKTLSQGEIALSDNKFAELKVEYNDEQSLKKRKSWVNRIKTTGTHIAGLEKTSSKNIKMISGENYGELFSPGNTFMTNLPYPISSYRTQKQLKRFIVAYETKGLVNLGEIKPQLD